MSTHATIPANPNTIARESSLGLYSSKLDTTLNTAHFKTNYANKQGSQSNT